MIEMAEFIPMELGVLGARVAAEQGLANYAAPTFNTVITNVPGPQTPYYSNGAKHVRGWGLGPCVDGNGLFHAVGSYCGEVNIGVTSCRAMMPDPSRYAELLRESFAELEIRPAASSKNSARRKTRQGAARKKATAGQKAHKQTKPEKESR
jgi:hypothetical protein